MLVGVEVGEGGMMRLGVVGDFCRAIAELIHDHPAAAEYTARKLGTILELEDQRHRREELEREERRRSTGSSY